ncbi:hypothetical protein C4J81_05195 [Deltaproteobacteria bacterium Smac51]|nr:hypothetical protein C4J81_05195 [Deltaproteobacteria bacterium Smac51]
MDNRLRRRKGLTIVESKGRLSFIEGAPVFFESAAQNRFDDIITIPIPPVKQQVCLFGKNDSLSVLRPLAA